MTDPGLRKVCRVLLKHKSFVSANNSWVESTYLDFENETQNSGSMFRWHPPTMAMLDSPILKLWQAVWRATKLDEHAVSVVKLGPLRSKK